MSNQKLKIGITCYPSLGGSGVVATELGLMLAKRGHEIHFISSSLPFRLNRLPKNVFFHEVEVSDYYVFRYPPYGLSLASKMASVVKDFSLDLLHVHYTVPHTTSALLAKQMVNTNLKVITTLHGTDITVLAQENSFKDIIQYSLMNSDAVTAVSNDLILQTHRLLGEIIPIERIYNFVDANDFMPRGAFSRIDFADPHEKILIHISNFRPVKRTEDVIDIFSKVNKIIPSKLILIGDGPDLPKVNEKVRILALEDKVKFLGKQDQVTELYLIADLLLLPSEKESFGLVALEAMASGVPTVGSDTGGIPEVIKHGKTGYLSPIGDVEGMANQAIQILNTTGLHERFKQAGIERARSYFDSGHIVAQYERLYYRVMNPDKQLQKLESEAY
ncbi:N-acetyl-alpha-D-glucosaminyl L-malate synthase BshA [Paenibacillus camerounensis]|uniref:N-acetyl-alpha-D-glucosaminyl L-malate synthase BshA n=1 Tax=Paenibacillus camerounensis TaxID=1243663 RepID=UPI0005A772F8|nr:N-acetyl-alpha-D-glucosaminyl L-malate synthase BshA [Paenibacillus camerounensis]